MAELRQVSDEWLAITPTNGAEKGFFLGWFDDETMRNCPIAAVHDPQGRITAFANLISEYQLNETTIDLMRHRRVVASGTMDYLVVSLFKWAQEKGYDSFNLGLSALSGIGERPDSPRIERVLHWLYESGYRTSEGSQRYNFKGLRNFKAKFRPSWTPQYLMLPSLINLPAVWISMALVNAGGWEAKWGYAKRRGSEELEVRRIGGRD
jgi:phosphatidylglycerol lysyltransferase